MTGNMLALAYLIFQTEVGIGGDILLCPFEKYGDLATHGFFRHLWQLLSCYGVSLRLPQESLIPVLWVDDHPFMVAVSDTGVFSSAELVAINIFRHHKRVYLIRDIVSCDGLTDKPSMLTMAEGQSTLEFPRQKPTCVQYTLWQRAVRSLTTSGTRLRIPLGSYTAVPHCPDD